MKLAEYVRKRDFKKTKEPRGAVAAKTSHLFIIQKHAATRLHYDFRLALDGTLKSWAVPKGPSWNPEDKRLAVHVEDHPMEYGTFEGTIPQGEYGGGTVMLWEKGQWFPEGDAAEGYAKGNLKFRLEGERLKGRWALVQMKGTASGDGKNWLLIKEKDDVKLRSLPTVEKYLTSVKTGRTMEQIANTSKAVWSSKTKTASKAKSKPASKSKSKPVPEKAAPITAASTLPMARKAPFPDSFKPQLATLTDQAPAGEQWIHEVKYDGYRLIAFVRGGKVRLFTRNEQDWTDRFPSIAEALEKMPIREAILDGEVVVQKSDGTTDFQALQNALKNRERARIAYYVFDLPYCDGHDLKETPLLERKKLLKQFFPELTANGPVRYSSHIEGKGKEVFQNACHLSLEGIVSKNVDSSYVHRRSPDWLKVKCAHRQEFVIGGYTHPKGSRSHFGSLLLGYHDKQGKLVYSGHVGTGFDNKLLTTIYKELHRREQKKSPFHGPMERSIERDVVWVKPELVGEVQFAGWTSDGVLRHPSFEGLREDKDAREVVIERTPAEQAQASESNERQAPETTMKKAKHRQSEDDADTVAGVALTHPDRVLYPDQGITKRDLCLYYERIADHLLPHIKGRPLSMVRCPRGEGQACFYQKHFTESEPESVRGIRIKEKEKTDTYILVDDVKGLVSLVQMGVLEVHPWGSTEKHLEKPDLLVFDLDPAPKLDWSEVVFAARLLRKLLDEAGLTSFLKTTGGKGLHVVAPVEPELSWDDFKDFSRSVAEHLVALHPDKYVATMSKAQRDKKIFIDFFRNGRGATSVAPYSTRARRGATVSTPLSWNELSPRLNTQEFTVESVPKRLEQHGDPWGGFFKIRQRITDAAVEKFKAKPEGVTV
jgi:bifunctional non-homologous end joining protein LigD